MACAGATGKRPISGRTKSPSRLPPAVSRSGWQGRQVRYARGWRVAGVGRKARPVGNARPAAQPGTDPGPAVGEQGRRRYDSPLRRERAAQTRERITDAGVALVRELPTWDWQGLTFAAVAARAQVSVRTVYRYFATERDLHDAIIGGSSRRPAASPTRASRSVTCAGWPHDCTRRSRRSRSPRGVKSRRTSPPWWKSTVAAGRPCWPRWLRRRATGRQRSRRWWRRYSTSCGA